MGLPLSEAPNHFAAQGARDELVGLSGDLRVLAVALVKIANDLRWMSSGPRTGLAEIRLPDLQPGSSIMPGKVNPVLPEAVTQVAAQVIGNDATVAFAGSQGSVRAQHLPPGHRPQPARVDPAAGLGDAPVRRPVRGRHRGRRRADAHLRRVHAPGRGRPEPAARLRARGRAGEGVRRHRARASAPSCSTRAWWPRTSWIASSTFSASPREAAGNVRSLSPLGEPMGLPERWICDGKPSERFPLYTRGNVGEVFPWPVTPATWTLGVVQAAEPGWRDALERFGAFQLDEFSPTDTEVIGCFGGYCYLNAAVSRCWACAPRGSRRSRWTTPSGARCPASPRTSGWTATRTRERTEDIQATLGWVFSSPPLTDLEADQAKMTDLRAARPDFEAMSDRRSSPGTAGSSPRCAACSPSTCTSPTAPPCRSV